MRSLWGGRYRPVLGTDSTSIASNEDRSFLEKNHESVDYTGPSAFKPLSTEMRAAVCASLEASTPERPTGPTAPISPSVAFLAFIPGNQ